MNESSRHTPIDLIIAAAAVVTRVRLAVLLSRAKTGPGQYHALARRIAQVAALQEGHTPTAVGDAFGRDRTTIIGRPGRVDEVSSVHGGTIAEILNRAREFAAMPRDRVDRIVDGVGRVALPPDLPRGAGRHVHVPVRVACVRGAPVLRAVS